MGWVGADLCGEHAIMQVTECDMHGTGTAELTDGCGG
jgi:hypothetical protein